MHQQLLQHLAASLIGGTGIISLVAGLLRPSLLESIKPRATIRIAVRNFVVTLAHVALLLVVLIALLWVIRSFGTA